MLFHENSPVVVVEGCSAWIACDAGRLAAECWGAARFRAACISSCTAERTAVNSTVWSPAATVAVRPGGNEPAVVVDVPADAAVVEVGSVGELILSEGQDGALYKDQGYRRHYRRSPVSAKTVDSPPVRAL